MSSLYILYQVYNLWPHVKYHELKICLERWRPRRTWPRLYYFRQVFYYRPSISNMSAGVAPLDEMRKKGAIWKWGKPQQKAWKKLLSSGIVLTLYNVKLPVKPDTDVSSQQGLGAVLSNMSNILPDGTARPAEYFSRTLTPAENNYLQIDKEAGSAIVWAIRRLHLYLYGRKYKLVTDNQRNFLSYFTARTRNYPWWLQHDLRDGLCFSWTTTSATDQPRLMECRYAVQISESRSCYQSIKLVLMSRRSGPVSQGTDSPILYTWGATGNWTPGVF